MKTLSVSELITARNCPREHNLKYQRRLRPNASSSGWQAASGNAVHYVIEQHCRSRSGELPLKADVEALIFESLDADFKGDDRKIEKYTPGVRRALSKTPQWVWTTSWYIEHDIEGTFTDRLECNHGPVVGPQGDEFDWCKTYGEYCNKVRLKGRPDSYHVGENFVELVDFKTTATNPLVFMLWTPQLRYYAAMLKQMYPDKLVRYRYVCLPTQGTGPGPDCAPWPFKQAALQRAEAEIVAYAAQIDDDGFRNPHYTRVCDWCDFKEVCIAVVTGADYESLIEEEYHVRPTA